MAAIFHSTFDTTSPPPLWDSAPEATPVRRPSHLRVLDGGRSPRSMARVYRRRRAVAVVVGVGFLVITVFGVGALFGVIDAASDPVQPGAVSPAAAATGPVLVVQAGDTLSSIARRLQPSGDTTALVDRLAAVHGPGPLQAGDRLPLAGLPLAVAPGS